MELLGSTMVLYLAGKYDEAMQIGDFKAEFVRDSRRICCANVNAHA
jgi:hypothetical protein